MAGKLVVIVGETASGKSALGMKLAGRFNGEIICADSRTVYKGMDKGTAKPSAADQARIPHHLLDILEPDQNFTAAEFKKLANDALADITSRGKLPIMVGGTGLYIDGVLFDFGFDENDSRKPLRANTLIIGLQITREELKERIAARTQQMIKDSLGKEVKTLAKKYGWNIPAMTGIGYREFQANFAGMQSLDETAARIERNTILYAKRQRTWFKRNKYIHWINLPSESIDLVTTFLNT